MSTKQLIHKEIINTTWVVPVLLLAIIRRPSHRRVYIMEPPPLELHLIINVNFCHLNCTCSHICNYRKTKSSQSFPSWNLYHLSRTSSSTWTSTTWAGPALILVIFRILSHLSYFHQGISPTHLSRFHHWTSTTWATPHHQLELLPLKLHLFSYLQLSKDQVTSVVSIMEPPHLDSSNVSTTLLKRQPPVLTCDC